MLLMNAGMKTEKVKSLMAGSPMVKSQTSECFSLKNPVGKDLFDKSFDKKSDGKKIV